MTAELVVVKGKDRGVSLALSQDGVHTIGRAEGQSLRLRADKKCSTAHARVTVTGGDRFMLEDLASTNGTFVNGERVHTSPLRSGDRVKIGHTLLVFRTDAGSVHLSDLDLEKEDGDGDSSGATPAPDHAAKLRKTGSLKRSRSGSRDGSGAFEEALLALGGALTDAKDVRAQLDALLRVVLQATSAARAILFVRDTDSGALGAATAIGRDGSRENAPVDSDVLRDAVSGQLAGPSGDGQAVAAPLRIGERVLGALYVDDPGGRTPAPREAQLLTTCAAIVAQALRADRLERVAESAIEVVSLAQTPAKRGTVDLVPVVAAAARLYGPVAEARGIKFETRVPGAVNILGDEVLVSRALDCLVETALVAAKNVIRIELFAEGSVAQLMVSRGGTPIPEALSAELVAPASPAGDLKAALGRLSDGALAVVRAAIARSGGRLLVEAGLPDVTGRGTEKIGPAPAVTFRLELPVAT
jgi:pSer/pThr/pTyr-binding forkhead associated (FHA) protein